MKEQYFIGDEDNGFEPCCGILSVADGSIRSIGQLIAASICNGGPGPGFIAPWVFDLITGGIQTVLTSLPSELVAGSVNCKLFKEVFFISIHILLC